MIVRTLILKLIKFKGDCPTPEFTRGDCEICPFFGTNNCDAENNLATYKAALAYYINNYAKTKKDMNKYVVLLVETCL